MSVVVNSDVIEAACVKCGKVTKCLQFPDGTYCPDCVVQRIELTPKEVEALPKGNRVHDLRSKIQCLKDARTDADRSLWNSRIWDELDVEKVVINPGKDGNFYHFKMPDGEIVLDQKDCLDARKFRMEFQRLTHVLLPPINNTRWACQITQWLNKNEEGESEEISEDQELVDEMRGYLTSARLVKGMGGPVFGTAYTNDNGSVLVPNEIIKKLVTRINRNLNLRHAADVLKPLLNKPSRTYSTPEGLVRMWSFDAAASGVDLTKAIELGDENEKGETQAT